MATTDYDFTQTRTQIIERAFRIIGVLGPGQTLSGEQAVQAIAALNMLVKQWQTKRIFLWTIQEDSQAFTTGDQSVTLGNDILGLDKVWYRQNNNQDIPVTIISFHEYEEFVNKQTTSNYPHYCAIDYDRSTPTLYIWPKASQDFTLYFLAVKRLQDMDTSSGGADIPTRFLQALTYGLADLLADEYGKSIQERSYIKSKYDEYFLEAANSDYEFEHVTMVAPSYED